MCLHTTHTYTHTHRHTDSGPNTPIHTPAHTRTHAQMQTQTQTHTYTPAASSAFCSAAALKRCVLNRALREEGWCLHRALRYLNSIEPSGTLIASATHLQHQALSAQQQHSKHCVPPAAAKFSAYVPSTTALLLLCYCFTTATPAASSAFCSATALKRCLSAGSSTAAAEFSAFAAGVAVVKQ